MKKTIEKCSWDNKPEDLLPIAFDTELILKELSFLKFSAMPNPVLIDNETYKHIHIELHLKAGGPINGTFAGIRRDVDYEGEPLGYNVIGVCQQDDQVTLVPDYLLE